MIRPIQYRADPKPLELKPRPPGGRKRFVPAEKRAQLYALMKLQRETDKEIHAIMDSCGDGTGWGEGRGRNAILRRIWLEKGR